MRWDQHWGPAKALRIEQSSELGVIEGDALGACDGIMLGAIEGESLVGPELGSTPMSSGERMAWTDGTHAVHCCLSVSVTAADGAVRVQGGAAAAVHSGGCESHGGGAGGQPGAGACGSGHAARQPRVGPAHARQQRHLPPAGELMPNTPYRPDVQFKQNTRNEMLVSSLVPPSGALQDRPGGPKGGGRNASVVSQNCACHLCATVLVEFRTTVGAKPQRDS